MAIYCPSLRQFIKNNLFLSKAVDSAARFSQNFGIKASFHRDVEVWLKSFNFKSFCDLKIIYFLDSVRLSKTSGPSRPHCAAVKSSENTAGDP